MPSSPSVRLRAPPRPGRCPYPAQPRGCPPHRTLITVCGFHLDNWLHVNNARYLELLEQARWAWLEERELLEQVLRPDGPALVIVNMNINFRHPAGLRQILATTSSIKDVGARSVAMRQEITLEADGTPILDADLTGVIMDREETQALQRRHPRLKGARALLPLVPGTRLPMHRRRCAFTAPAMP